MLNVDVSVPVKIEGISICSVYGSAHVAPEGLQLAVSRRDTYLGV